MESIEIIIKRFWTDVPEKRNDEIENKHEKSGEDSSFYQIQLK